MNYRHGFHAGNFADTVKHVILIAILRALQKKPAPFFYLDTHSGRGRYRFAVPTEAESGPHAPSKITDRWPANAEFAAGFERLRRRSSLPDPIADYVALIESLGDAPAPGAPLRFYAGSPLIAARLLRSNDRAVLFELGMAEAEKLRATMRSFKNVAVHCADGYAALRSQLPPRERRGLVLIDPAYELQEREFPLVVAALRAGYARWATGIFAIWYPIKRRATVDLFHEQLRQTGIRKILCAELRLYPDDSRVSLNGCGVAIVNPPWQLDRTLQNALPALHEALGGQPGTSADCFWLVPE